MLALGGFWSTRADTQNIHETCLCGYRLDSNINWEGETGASLRPNEARIHQKHLPKLEEISKKSTSNSLKHFPLGRGDFHLWQRVIQRQTLERLEQPFTLDRYCPSASLKYSFCLPVLRNKALTWEPRVALSVSEFQSWSNMSSWFVFHGSGAFLLMTDQ